MLKNGKIRPSKSSAGTTIFFAKEANGKLRIVVNYCRINAITIKDKNPVPLMTTLMKQVGTFQIFLKLDLKLAFNLLRIAEGEEWKTAFKTRYDRSEYTVLPFGLTNAPSVFQRRVNNILAEKIDRGVVMYIDNLLIYSETEEEDIELVRWVLQKLTENNLCINIDKCVFHVLELEFVGFQVGKQGIQMSQKKVEDIVNWLALRNVKEVQRFIRFANFYRQFIPGFSSLALPIQVLTHNGAMWNWSEQFEKVFVELKGKFTTAPIVCHYHPERKKQIETNSSDLCKAGILSQYEPDRHWHPLSYYNKRFVPTELNYHVHDKEIVVIVNCFQQWRHFLNGAAEEIVVFTNHKNLECFNTTKL